MSRSFSSISAFVTFMNAKIAGLPAVQKRALTEAAKVVEDEAHRIPGTYQPGWPKLQAETIARKATGDSPLRESGAMAESYGSTVFGPEKAAVGSNDPKATWQELGTSRGIAPRPVLKTAAVRKEAEVHGIIARAVIGHLAGTSNR